MGYEEFKVGIEYDGEQHWTDRKRRAHDIERRIELAEHGWVTLGSPNVDLWHANSRTACHNSTLAESYKVISRCP